MNKTISSVVSSFRDGLISKAEFINSMYEFHQAMFEYVELMKDSDLKKIEIDDGVIFHSRLENLKFKFSYPDKRAAPFEILNFKKYEVNDSKLIYNLIDSDSIFFDIGANIGWYSLHVAKKISLGKVYSFEPVPSTFNQLKLNVSLNQIENISIVNVALSDSEGELELFTNEHSSVSSSSQNILNDQSARKIFVPKTTLDQFVETQLIQKINFIKCDVEGAECFVIKGGIASIKKFRPIIFLEMLRKWSAKFSYHPNDLIKTLSDLNYSCFSLGEKSELEKIQLIDEETLQTNFLFIPNELDIKQINERILNA